MQKEAASDDAQGWLSNHDAGSGPFQQPQIEQSGNITVARYDSYWEAAEGRPKTIVYRLIKETATQRDELRGELRVRAGPALNIFLHQAPHAGSEQKGHVSAEPDAARSTSRQRASASSMRAA